MYMFGTLIDGICLDDSTWLKVHHWYYLILWYMTWDDIVETLD
jgi:hypothetical protein